MAKSDDKKARASDADRLKVLKKKLKKLKASVKEAAAGLEVRTEAAVSSAAGAAAAAIKEWTQSRSGKRAMVGLLVGTAAAAIGLVAVARVAS